MADINEVKKLIHETVRGADDNIEYEPEDYSNSDALDEGDLEEVAEAVPEEEAPVEEEIPEPQVDWQALVETQQRELTQLKQERVEREKSDYERRKNELTGDEKAEFIENYHKERERLAEMEQIRKEQAASHPLSTLLVAPMLEYFDIEIDDPLGYTRAMDAVEKSTRDLWENMLKEGIARGVKAEMDAFYAETGQQWGTNKLGSAQPRPLEPRNPVRNQYELKRKEMARPGIIKTTDDLTNLIRQRQSAKRGR